MFYVKIGGTQYPAIVSGSLMDASWDGRASKTILLTMDYATAASLFRDGVSWSMVSVGTVEDMDADGNPTGTSHEVTEEFDNSDYSILGDITAHRDGTVSIKMGRPTEAETAKAQAASATAALKILGYTEA